LFVAAAAGNAAALEVFQETGWYLGIACANLINLLNPEVIVMGGGVMGAGEMLLAAARREARLRSFGPSFDHCQIVQSSLWPEAGVIGAAMLARDRQKG
jgi:glucokinase